MSNETRTDTPLKHELDSPMLAEVDNPMLATVKLQRSASSSAMLAFSKLAEHSTTVPPPPGLWQAEPSNNPPLAKFLAHGWENMKNLNSYSFRGGGLSTLKSVKCSQPNYDKGSRRRRKQTSPRNSMRWLHDPNQQGDKSENPPGLPDSGPSSSNICWPGVWLDSPPGAQGQDSRLDHRSEPQDLNTLWWSSWSSQSWATDHLNAPARNTTQSRRQQSAQESWLCEAFGFRVSGFRFRV